MRACAVLFTDARENMMIKGHILTSVPPSIVTNGNAEITTQLQLCSEYKLNSNLLMPTQHLDGTAQAVNMVVAACLSAKENFTSRLTSEPAIQWRRQDLAGNANVSAQS